MVISAGILCWGDSEVFAPHEHSASAPTSLETSVLMQHSLSHPNKCQSLALLHATRSSHRPCKNSMPFFLNARGCSSVPSAIRIESEVQYEPTLVKGEGSIGIQPTVRRRLKIPLRQLGKSLSIALIQHSFS